MVDLSEEPDIEPDILDEAADAIGVAGAEHDNVAQLLPGYADDYAAQSNHRSQCSIQPYPSTLALSIWTW